MKKHYFFIAVFVAVCASSLNVQAQNLIATWNGNGITGTNSEENKWGWASTYSAATWGTANGSGVRYIDVTGTSSPLHKLASDGSTYIGRVMLYRYDGSYWGSTLSLGNGDGTTTTVTPITLQSSTSYTFSGLYEWWNNGTLPTYTVNVSTAQTGGTILATKDFASSATKNLLQDMSMTFTNTGSTGTYYLQIKQKSGTGTSDGSMIGFVNLSLVSNGLVSYLTTDSTSLSFTPSKRSKIINIHGGGLTNDVTLSTKGSSFNLSQSTIPVANVSAVGGVNLTVSATSATDVKDTITLISGTTIKKIPLSLTSVMSINTRAFFCDQTTQDTVRINVSGDLYSNIALSAPAGVALVNAVDKTPISTITVADALAGKVIRAQWDRSTRIVDQKITLASGLTKDSVVVKAVPDNVIPHWDADTITVAGSSLAASGWTQTDATGTDLGALSQLYNTAGGIRIVPIAGSTSAALHTYLGKTQAFGRTAYLRTWGAAAPYNSFNLSVGLNPSLTYVFKGVVGWHNNGAAAPNVTISVNTAKSGLGTTLASQTVNCATKQAGYDFSFEFTSSSSVQHYLVITCDQSGDVMISPDYLAIYSKNNVATSTAKLSDIGMTVTVKAGELSVRDVTSYIVYNMQGMKIAGVPLNTLNSSVKLNQGVYIVKSDSSVQKVIIP